MGAGIKAEACLDEDPTDEARDREAGEHDLQFALGGGLGLGLGCRGRERIVASLKHTFQMCCNNSGS